MKILLLGLLAIVGMVDAGCRYGKHYKLQTDEVSSLGGCHYFRCLETGHWGVVQFSKEYPFKKDCDVCRAHRLRTFDGTHYDAEESGCPVVMVQDLKALRSGLNTPWHHTMWYGIGVNFKPCISHSSVDMACVRQTRFKDGAHTIDIDHDNNGVSVHMGDNLLKVIKATDLSYEVTMQKKYRRHDGTPPLLLWRKDINGEACAMVSGSSFSIMACSVSLHIWVGAHHHGKFVGLCGLYNENSADDLLGSDMITYKSDDIEEVQKFKKTWKITPSCEPFDATEGIEILKNGCEKKQQYEEECTALYSDAMRNNVDAADIDEYKNRCVRNKCAVLEAYFEEDMAKVNKMEAQIAKVAEETIQYNGQ